MIAAVAVVGVVGFVVEELVEVEAGGEPVFALAIGSRRTKPNNFELGVWTVIAPESRTQPSWAWSRTGTPAAKESQLILCH